MSAPLRPAEEIARGMVVSTMQNRITGKAVVAMLCGGSRVYVDVDSDGEADDLRRLIARLIEQIRAEGAGGSALYRPTEAQAHTDPLLAACAQAGMTEAQTIEQMFLRHRDMMAALAHERDRDSPGARGQHQGCRRARNGAVPVDARGEDVKERLLIVLAGTAALGLTFLCVLAVGQTDTHMLVGVGLGIVVGSLTEAVIRGALERSRARRRFVLDALTEHAELHGHVLYILSNGLLPRPPYVLLWRMEEQGLIASRPDPDDPGRRIYSIARSP